MKFTLSAVVLALAASQAAAVVPVPVKECTHSYVVEPGTPDCVAFATKFGITFADLLKWNDKLRPDCANLDVGEPLCVSITKGDGPLNENPKGAQVPQPGVPPQGNLWDPAPYTKGPAGTSTGAPPAATTPAAGTATTPAANKPTTSAAGATTSGAAGATPSVKTDTKNSGAASNKNSIVLGAAGLLLSAVYML
ncbi:hypothetical protein K457DRAFT_18358 [Linnemannia elongata AG-77]|uniref:LysM domain-containing protein n=1 Tax=Linnemannia elongata AG-77 TaxID=1314771 RepID=A0A197JZX3_9FUNG|nr:hypothetical protein K457DRAFT_18358 [Linnemannia elongata AG-77]